MSRLNLGPVGVALNVSRDDSHLREAAELEDLGYAAIWLPGGQIDRLGRIADVVLATKTVTVGSAIIPLDVYDSPAVAQLFAELEASAPGRFVVLGTDAARARALGRQPLGFLSTVAGYRANFARMGFTEAEIAGLADRLVDELVAWGDADAIVARTDAHLRAGADQVVLTFLPGDSPVDAAQQVAAELGTRLAGGPPAEGTQHGAGTPARMDP